MKNIFKIILFALALVMLLSAFSTFAVFADGTDAETVVEENVGDTNKEVVEEADENEASLKEGVESFYTDEDGNHILVLEDGKEFIVEAKENIADETDGDKTVDIKFDTTNLVESLGYMWKGMLAIFIVIAVIIISVLAMNFCSDKAEARKKAREAEEN
ncbi:MAG: hypothetical protein J6L85_08095 [Clostridia bacterium]|nr:hypothetical protein [Clostridia bacterium]